MKTASVSSASSAGPNAALTDVAGSAATGPAAGARNDAPRENEDAADADDERPPARATRGRRDEERRGHEEQSAEKDENPRAGHGASLKHESPR